MPVISVVSLKLDLSSVQEEMNSLKMKIKHTHIYIMQGIHASKKLCQRYGSINCKI